MIIALTLIATAAVTVTAITSGASYYSGYLSGKDFSPYNNEWFTPFNYLYNWGYKFGEKKGDLSRRNDVKFNR